MIYNFIGLLISIIRAIILMIFYWMVLCMIKSFDITKLILSILVVCIHVNPLLSYSGKTNFYLVNTICRIAVPLFFMMAGYLLFLKINNLDEEKYKNKVTNYLKRIFTIYLIWSIIYFIPFLFDRNIFNVSEILKFIYHFLVNGVYRQIWYLQSLLVSVILVSYLNYKIGIKKTLLISFILYLFGLVLVPYYPLFVPFFDNIIIIKKLLNLFITLLPNFSIARNGITFGMVFVSLGAFFAIYPPKTLHKNYMGGGYYYFNNNFIFGNNIN